MFPVRSWWRLGGLAVASICAIRIYALWRYCDSLQTAEILDASPHYRLSHCRKHHVTSETMITFQGMVLRRLEGEIAGCRMCEHRNARQLIPHVQNYG